MLPNKVKVGGIEYTVETVDEIDSDPEIAGDCMLLKQKLRLRDGMAKERTMQTFIHEVMHAVFFEAGYTDKSYEDEVNRLSLVLYQVLKDNPKLLSE